MTTSKWFKYRSKKESYTEQMYENIEWMNEFEYFTTTKKVISYSFKFGHNVEELLVKNFIKNNLFLEFLPRTLRNFI